MKNFKSQFLLDIKNRMILSLKLMFHNKMTMLVIMLGVISIFFLLQILHIGAEENSNIPIGVVNYDITSDMKEPTLLSSELVDGLYKIDAIHIYTGTFENLYEELIEGNIFAIFVIQEGYGKNLEKGDFKNLITVYQGSESKIAKLLQDIVAGEMLYRICLTRGVQLYSSLKEGEVKKYSTEEYKAYSDSIKDSDIFDFRFDTQFVSTKNNIVTGEMLNNKLIYRQVIGAIFAMILSFIVLFAGTYLPLEKAQGLRVRLKLSRMNLFADALGNLFAILLLVFIPNIIFSVLFQFYIGKGEKFFSVLAATYGYVFVITIIILLLAKFSKSIFIYQLLGAILVLLFGASGMISIVDDMMLISSKIFHIVPNSWFIKLIADIMI